MKKIRLNTTISSKHYALLEKYTEEFSTKQKVLEHALEALENNSNQNAKLSPEKELWMRLADVNQACILGKDFLKVMMSTLDIEKTREYVKREKPQEYTIELFLQKPLKECSLKEVVDALVINWRISHVFDTVDCIDDKENYSIQITHNLGLNNSQAIKMMGESVFESYGARYESSISEKTVFMKIFKKS